MNEIIWLNGQIIPMSEAHIGVEDRGFQFADGVYEVVRLYDGRAFTLRKHLDRLYRSCDGLMLSMPIDRDALAGQMRTLVQRSGVRDGMIYLQLTRGVSRRNHAYPADATSTLLFYARPLPPIEPPDHAAGVKLWTVPDERWRKCWIKSIALTANVLAKNIAISHGADEAAFVDEAGVVAECSASNLFAVINGELITHPVGPRVLPGVTRDVLLECARALNIPAIERPLILHEAKAADELFITSTTRQISWVGQWDGAPLPLTRCGPITLKLHQAFEAYRQRDLAGQEK